MEYLYIIILLISIRIIYLITILIKSGGLYLAVLYLWWQKMLFWKQFGALSVICHTGEFFKLNYLITLITVIWESPYCHYYHNECQNVKRQSACSVMRDTHDCRLEFSWMSHFIIKLKTKQPHCYLPLPSNFLNFFLLHNVKLRELY